MTQIGANLRKDSTGLDRDLRANLMLVLLGVGGFVLAIGILLLLGVAGKELDLALYLFAVALLPWLCAIACLKLQYPFPDVSETVIRHEYGSLAFLLIVLAALPLLFFDFSMAVEPLHYLTILGPAVHLLNGGTLLVDTFSQYGPGPVLTTLAGFALGPRRGAGGARGYAPSVD